MRAVDGGITEWEGVSAERRTGKVGGMAAVAVAAEEGRNRTTSGDTETQSQTDGIGRV